MAALLTAREKYIIQLEVAEGKEPSITTPEALTRRQTYLDSMKRMQGLGVQDVIDEGEVPPADAVLSPDDEARHERTMEWLKTQDWWNNPSE